MSSADLPPLPRLPSRVGPKRRAPRERALTRETVAEAALNVVDQEGLDAVTMRRVADALGTGAASLYSIVANKEELLELVVERVLGEIQVPAELDPEHWQEQLKQVLRTVRAVFASHRDIARASFARVPLGENALRTSEWMIGLLRAGGLPDRVVAYAVDLLPMYVTAIAYEESLYAGEGSTLEDVARYVADLRRYFESLPAGRFPNIVALAGPLTAGAEGDQRFEFGLEVLVRGLAAMAE